jgi:hypothetical protein
VDPSLRLERNTTHELWRWGAGPWRERVGESIHRIQGSSKF